MRQAAADRAPGADRRVADVRGGVREQRAGGADAVGAGRRRRWRVIAPSTRRDAVVEHVRELADPVQVDQHGRRRQPQVHQRHEALPAGERLRVVAVLGEQLDALRDRGRRVVGEPRRLHRDRPLAVGAPLRQPADELAVAAGRHLGDAPIGPVVEAAAGLGAQLAPGDAIAEAGLRLRRAVEVGQQVGVDRGDHVEAAEVGRLQRADRREPDPEARAHGQVDVGGRRDAGVEQRDRLAHDGLLHPRAEEAEHLVAQHDRHLADRAHELGGLVDPRLRGVLAARHLDDRHQVRRVPEVQRDHPLAVSERRRDVRHPQARRCSWRAARPARRRPRRRPGRRASPPGPRPPPRSRRPRPPARRAPSCRGCAPPPDRRAAARSCAASSSAISRARPSAEATRSAARPATTTSRPAAANATAIPGAIVPVPTIATLTPPPAAPAPVRGGGRSARTAAAVSRRRHAS